MGHASECHWPVQDRHQNVPAKAFTISLHDGAFCLHPLATPLWLNQAKVTAASDQVQLRQGDEIQTGQLILRVHLNRGEMRHYDEEMATPETIVSNHDILSDTLLSTDGTPEYPGMPSRHQLADTVVNGFFHRSVAGTAGRKSDHEGRSTFSDPHCPTIRPVARSGDKRRDQRPVYGSALHVC